MRSRNVYVWKAMASSHDGGRDSQQLPPGRHGLSRSFVVQNQRERILAAVADVTSAASYAEMTVADIIVCAGVSRRTFYEHFANKQDAYLAAYDEAVGRLLEGVRWAYGSKDTFAERMRAGIELFVTVLAADPAFARMCIVEVTSAGAEALQRRDATMGEFARMIDENARAGSTRSSTHGSCAARCGPCPPSSRICSTPGCCRIWARRPPSQSASGWRKRGSV